MKAESSNGRAEKISGIMWNYMELRGMKELGE
jgi:hypothetical protein